MNRYYILENGCKKGPFSLQELKNKNIRASTYIWMSGMNDWAEAKNIPELSGLLLETPPPPPSMPNSFLVPSILATIFCCLPFGVVGIINALKVSEAYEIGDYAKAKKYSEIAEEWSKIALGTGLVIFFLSLTILLIIQFSNFAYSKKMFI